MASRDSSADLVDRIQFQSWKLEQARGPASGSLGHLNLYQRLGQRLNHADFQQKQPSALQACLGWVIAKFDSQRFACVEVVCDSEKIGICAICGNCKVDDCCPTYYSQKRHFFFIFISAQHCCPHTLVRWLTSQFSLLPCQEPGQPCYGNFKPQFVKQSRRQSKTFASQISLSATRLLCWGSRYRSDFALVWNLKVPWSDFLRTFSVLDSWFGSCQSSLDSYYSPVFIKEIETYV